MRRLTGDEHLSNEFATAWRSYQLDEDTEALLEYAEKPAETPDQIDDADIEALQLAGLDQDAIYEATALIAFFNFSARLEAAAGLPAHDVPAAANPPEARAS